MSRLSRMSTMVAALAVASLVAACGASTENPETTDSGNETGQSQEQTDTTGAEADTGAESETETPAESETETPAESETEAGADLDVVEPEPLNLNLPVDEDLAAMLPASIADKGKLVIATDASYAPNEFLREGKGEPIGMTIDLGNAITQVLGLDAEWVNTGFDGILAGLNAGRYDIGMSSFTDTFKREEVVNFVTYLEAGTSIVVAAGNPLGVESAEDLCGLKVGAETGTTQEDMLTKADVDDSVVQTCEDAGKPAPEYHGYPNQTDVNVALASGRLDAYMADTPIAEYAVLVSGDKFEKVGADVGVAPYGIAVPKEPAELTTALQAAVQKLMDDGSYQKILDNWGLGDAAISKSEINAAVF